MKIWLPLPSFVLEKSPVFSAAVGTRMFTGANCGHLLLVVLLIDEEEQSVLSVPNRLSAFTKARQIDRTAQIPTIEVVAIDRTRCTQWPFGVIKVVVGVHTVMATEVTPGTVIVVCATACGNRNEAAGGPTVFGLIIRSEDLNLLNRVRVD